MYNSNPLHLISKPDAILSTLFLSVLTLKWLKTAINSQRQGVVNAYEACLLDSSPAVNLINPDSRRFQCEYDFAYIGRKCCILYTQSGMVGVMQAQICWIK